MHAKRTGLPVAASPLGIGLALLLLLAGCAGQPVLPGPTVPPVPPTMDVVGTVTAQAAPIVATQTAISAASTQITQAQATLTAQAEAQTAASTGTAIVQVAGAQVATATALAGSAAAQQSTATALAAANGTLVARTTAAPLSGGTPPPPTAVVAMAVTRTPIPTSSVACVAVDPEFAAIAGRAAGAGLDIGCPVAPAVANITGALQEFWANVSLSDPKTHWRSPAIWRGDTQDIYIVKGEDTQASKGSLTVYPDLYQDGQPEVPPACADMTPPGNSELPVRGFGKVWCDAGLATVVGWPNQREVRATLRIQPTRDGLLMKVSAPDATPPVGYLIAMDFQSARAVTNLIAP